MKPVPMRAHAGRALIAFAVLLPAALCVLAIAQSRRIAASALVQHLTPLMLVDAGLLALGLLLNRGQEL